MKKILLLIASFIFLMTSLVSANNINNLPECSTLPKNNCYGSQTYSEGGSAGDKYVGEFKNDKKHGLGTYIFAGGFTLGVSKHFDVEAHFESKPGLSCFNSG